MQGKVEICGVNTAKLKVLKNEEMTALIKRVKKGDQAVSYTNLRGTLPPKSDSSIWAQPTRSRLFPL